MADPANIPTGTVAPDSDVSVPDAAVTEPEADAAAESEPEVAVEGEPEGEPEGEREGEPEG
eukprot:SAG11_NODE_37854_length_255_cov_0.602564_1_plen_60_part_01